MEFENKELKRKMNSLFCNGIIFVKQIFNRNNECNIICGKTDEKRKFLAEIFTIIVSVV